MKISKKNWMVPIVMAAVMMLFAGFPATVMAGGEGGAGCGGEDAKYDPAPYIGTLTVEWVQTSPGLGNVIATGRVEQAGNPNCSGEFENYLFMYDVPFYSDATVLGFKDWDAKFLKGYCNQNIGVPFNCYSEESDFQMIAVGGMKWAADQKSFSAKFIIMKLLYK